MFNLVACFMSSMHFKGKPINGQVNQSKGPFTLSE